MFHLTEIMRQKDDKAFAIALNHLAQGLLTAEEITLFQSREISRGLIIPKSAIHLFYANDDCAFLMKTWII